MSTAFAPGTGSSDVLVRRHDGTPSTLSARARRVAAGWHRRSGSGAPPALRPPGPGWPPVRSQLATRMLAGVCVCVCLCLCLCVCDSSDACRHAEYLPVQLYRTQRRAREKYSSRPLCHTDSTACALLGSRTTRCGCPSANRVIILGVQLTPKPCGYAQLATGRAHGGTASKSAGGNAAAVDPCARVCRPGRWRCVFSA